MRVSMFLCGPTSYADLSSMLPDCEEGTSKAEGKKDRLGCGAESGGLASVTSLRLL